MAFLPISCFDTRLMSVNCSTQSVCLSHNEYYGVRETPPSNEPIWGKEINLFQRGLLSPKGLTGIISDMRTVVHNTLSILIV